ncbi:MAG: hypothetical protein QXK49_03015 [Candidatus Aenigmatarchaeota archaeon]
MVYPTLSHSILLLLGLLAASLLIFSISVALTTIERDLTKAELNFIADSAKNKILEAYSLANQTSNYTYGIFNLSLPEKIGNKKYSIALSQNSLLLNTSVKNQPIETSRYLAIDAELNGISFIPASIKIEKENEKIKIELIK